MSVRVIASGVERLLTNLADEDHLRPNTAEQKYVTFVNDLGAVHTIIVDVDHVAQDVPALIEWFNHTRTAVEHLFSATVPGDKSNAVKVLEHANSQVAPPARPAQPQQQGGGY